MQPIPAPGTRLLQYQSKPSMGLGVEVIADPNVDVQLLLEDLQWLLAGTDDATPPEFFVIEPPIDSRPVQLQAFARASAAKGLSEKVCLVIPLTSRPPDVVLSALLDHGVRILFGGVGLGTRFGELIDSFADGIVFDSELISQASGDPHVASVLEAASALATNLGLRTFANRCRRQAVIDVARSCGVNYLSLDTGCSDASAVVASPLELRPRESAQRLVDHAWMAPASRNRPARHSKS